MAPALILGGRQSGDSDSSSGSGQAPPAYYDLPLQPSLPYYDSKGFQPFTENVSPSCSNFDPKASTSTYASTIPSEEDLDPEEPEYEIPVDYERQYRNELVEPSVVASTPPEFAELFPSVRRLKIHHDDTTVDGNMNLRVDVPVSASHGRKQDITLFHLRMHDLRSREFSLRRYCRDSGREVCNSHKLSKKAITARPVLQRSVSSVISTFRGHKHDSKLDNSSSLRRQDSGYDSGEADDGGSISSKSPVDAGHKNTHLSNTTKLEFSNYAHVNVKRHGTSSSKRYDFEYWGNTYSWKRSLKKDAGLRQLSYHLVNEKSGKAIAHIVPDVMSEAEAAEEQSKGGWIPPSSFWISDASIISGLTDVADVIVATGLIALVDDSIARRFHQRRSVQISVPVPSKVPMKLNMEYVGPKKLIDEVFSRRNSHSSNASASARHPPTPLRQISAEA